MKLLKILLLPYMASVIVGAFLWPAPAQGFIGESSRIVFFHVPCAWTSALAFLVAVRERREERLDLRVDEGHRPTSLR